MGKLVISLDGMVIKEVQLTKDKTTLGRRPYNDIVIDNLAVSGEHAILQSVGGDMFIEDLHSTNGTYLNGKAIKKQTLAHNDTLEIGKYRLRYVLDTGQEFDKTVVLKADSSIASPIVSLLTNNEAQQHQDATQLPILTLRAPTEFGGALNAEPTTSPPSLITPPAAIAPATIKVLNGSAAGREVQLSKVVTTVGKPGVQVASITRRPTGYVFAHVEGAARPTVNGQSLWSESVQLKSGDVIELAGTQMQFLQF